MKFALLTFDIEEFDVPIEYNRKISEKESNKVALQGTKEILKILEQYKIKSTFFVTAKFAKSNKTLIKEIANKNEIALHGYQNLDNYNLMSEEDAYRRLKEAKNIIETIIKKRLIGFRAPRFGKINDKILLKLGIKYDSSINPTFIPFRYNDFFSSRHISGDKVKTIPISVTPLIRAPLFFAAFRNFGLTYAKIITFFCLLDQNFINLVFHSWDFYDISKYSLPIYIKRNTGPWLVRNLRKYIKWCLRNNIHFTTMRDYLENEKGLS